MAVRTTAVGTWVLKPSLQASVSIGAQVSGTYNQIRQSPESADSAALVYIEINAGNNTASFCQMHDNDGNVICNYFWNGSVAYYENILGNLTVGSTPSDQSVFLSARTFTITGGADAENTALIEWLEANTEVQPALPYKRFYRNTALVGSGAVKFRHYSAEAPTQ